MRLRECFDLHGCEKGSRHGYERVYEPLFEQFRNEPLAILEIGVFKGASIAAWLEYFPNAEIFGIDTFQRLEPECVPILKHRRVRWERADSTKRGSAEWVDRGFFDIVIDDGDHRAESQLKTFDNFYSALKPGGTYFIEDVWPDTKNLRKPGYHELIARLPKSTIHHDLRKGYAVDSYILEIRC